ncbi:MAG: YncE family protein [Deltaproteobacteria bacterium]|nr:YncE family protein [Deltaproteobacteria bacterium]
MMHARWLLLVGLLLLALSTAACSRSGAQTIFLEPDPNPMGAEDPLWSPQPTRDRPRSICVDPTGTKAWVMLAGTEDTPREDVAVVDLDTGTTLKRVHLGRSPWGCALDPSGRFLVVVLRFSDHAVVLDASSDEEVARIPVPFYTESAIWRPDGARVYLANRWKDSVIWWDVSTDGEFRLERASYDGISVADPMGTPVGENPGPLAFSSDGRFLFAGAVAGVTTAVLDAATGKAIDIDQDPTTTSQGAPPGMSRIDFRSPVGGLAAWGRWLFISDIGSGMGSLASAGRDLNFDGHPGDGTANVIFQDLQNEIAVVDAETFELVHRYTSDTICCADYRDVDPDRPDRGLLLPAPDTWPPEVVEFLAPKSTWIVAGALPEAMVVVDGVLWVAFAGSNEVQSFTIGADGSLSPNQVTGALFRTGYNPKAIAAARGRVVTVDRLGEGLTVIDPEAGVGQERRVVVGDTSGGPFPSTDAEIGEAINEMTAIFTIDGDQTCVHCHRENGAISRPIVMPLQIDRPWGARNVMAQRGLFDTRPWFFEQAMDQTNFFPVLNELARRENYCCERLDPTVWSKYPTAEACTQDPALAGCQHVLHCNESPPPECLERPYAKIPFLRRADFIRDAAQRLFGRDTTFGDVLFTAGDGGARTPLPLDFEGITRAVGLFMLRTPRLLPNPNRWLDLPTAARGKTLFQDAAVGCGLCHPLPRTTTADEPSYFSPFDMPLGFPPVISPSRSPAGTDATRVTPGFIATFPRTKQGEEGLHVGATPLRGIWDRPGTSLYHDGRARSLREALATPGHPVLAPGETGSNERNGVFDTHGGTSHLDKYQFEDLLNFLHTL